MLNARWGMIITTLSEENAALGFSSDSAAAKHQAWLEENGTPEFKAWFQNIKVAAEIAKITLETVYRERDPKNIAAKCAAERLTASGELPAGRD